MKNLLYTIVLAVSAASIFTACQKDKSKGKLDSNSKLYISPAPGVKSTDDTIHLSAREIVLQAKVISWPHNDNSEKHFSLGVDDWNRDTVNNRLIFGSQSVVVNDGTLNPEFIEARNLVLVTTGKFGVYVDTIAYIPNNTIRKAEKEIMAAYAIEDYTTCNKLFETAFMFTPINGKEWRDLEAANKQ